MEAPEARLGYSYLAVRPCGCATGLVRSDCSETARAVAGWQAQGWATELVPDAEAVARMVACGHEGKPKPASKPPKPKRAPAAQQLTMF